MARYVLIPGSGGMAWYWHRVVAQLRARGHTGVAVDLPGDDESAGLPEYVEIASAAVAGEAPVVLVAQSLGGFTAAAVASRVPVGMLVLVNAMIPLPGETPAEWWTNTAAEAARVEAASRRGYPAQFDLQEYFLHDVPPEVLATGPPTPRAEADLAFTQPCRITGWPEVPTRVLVAEDDRFFPAEFQCRVARERLGIEPELLPGGHLVALSRPVELSDRLVTFSP